MKLITKQLEEKFKKYPLYSQDGMGGDAKVIAKFFNPAGVGTWLIIEGNKLDDGDYEMFGYCHLGDDMNAELGYVRLSDLENIKLPFGLKIERDLYLRNNITLSEAIKENGFDISKYWKKDNSYVINKELNIDNLIENHKIPMIIDEFIDLTDDLTNENIMKDKLPDSHNILVYCDNDICYYDCNDGNYIYIDTREAIKLKETFSNDDAIVRVNELAANYLFIDYEGKELIKKLSKKYNTMNSINNNCYISDDFKLILDDSYQSNDNLFILENCVDYSILKESLIKADLIKINNVLNDFLDYQVKYDDGNMDIIREYTSKYGNSHIIDWYEGIIDTEDFIEDYKYKERSGECEK